MKNLIFSMITFLLCNTVNAQTWETPIYQIGGKPIVKTLKLKLQTSITIGTVILDSDTLKEDKYFTGSFLGVAGDSLKISFTEVRTNRNYENGTMERKTIHHLNKQTDKLTPLGVTNIALSDIHILKYIPKTRESIANIEDFVLFSSLAALIISPFFCYNYSNQTFNQDLYQYLALGSTIGIVAGISLQMMGGKKGIQFKDNWPNKKAKKIWSFKPITH